MVLCILLVIVSVFAVGSYILNEKWILSTVLGIVLLGMTLSYSYGYKEAINEIRDVRKECIEKYQASDKGYYDKKELISELQATNLVLEEIDEKENFYIITDICWLLYEKKAEDYIVEFGERTIVVPEYEEEIRI